MHKPNTLASRATPGSPALSKVWTLSKLAACRPTEFLDRLQAKAEVLVDRIRPTSRTRLQTWLGPADNPLVGYYGSSVSPLSAEHALVDIKREVVGRIRLLDANAPFKRAHNADFTLAKLCYVLCRLIKPNVVLETGVAYGVNTAFILKALDVNGRGVLHSVDLPPLAENGDKYVGLLVPEPLRARWQLHRGASRRVLPEVLLKLRAVDIFVHDSLHTYRNMRWEFATVRPNMTPGAIILADDVEGNDAFLEFAENGGCSFYRIMRQEKKGSLFGVAVFP